MPTCRKYLQEISPSVRPTAYDRPRTTDRVRPPAYDSPRTTARSEPSPAAVGRVPVRLDRLHGDPLWALVEERRRGPGREAEGGEVRRLPEGGPLIEVAGITPEAGEVRQGPFADL